MIPPLIIAAAQMAGLDIIGIADHNSCENAAAVIEAARESGIKVLPGMEAQSVEGVHLLCLFDDLDAALELQETIYASLPDVPGAAKFVDEQFVVDAEGEFVRYCEKAISLPTSLEIEEIWERVEGLGGLCIPSHIDRSGTGICGVLGMLPEEPRFEAVEISANLTPEGARAKHPSVGSLPIVQGSDSHWLEPIGEKRTVFHLEHRSLAEIRMALKSENGRCVE
jgi:PHP family Zn ribbon phosphoesterase